MEIFKKSEEIKEKETVDFISVLTEEQNALDKRASRSQTDWKKADDLAALYGRINAADRTALCLSGGGIRSAAFSLGVIQRFASVTIRSRTGEQTPLLCEFDYL